MEQSGLAGSTALDESNRRSARREGPGWESPRVLVISPDAAQNRALCRICAAPDWRAREAKDWRESVLVMSRTGADVILCDDHLPDGNWKDVLSVLSELPEAPRLIVLFENASPAEWSEVLNLGGFDVLNKPLEEADVIRALTAAWRNVQDARPPDRKNRSI